VENFSEVEKIFLSNVMGVVVMEEVSPELILTKLESKFY